eukprot:1158372-Pelagomonas_calceolata.AAC.6
MQGELQPSGTEAEKVFGTDRKAKLHTLFCQRLSPWRWKLPGRLPALLPGLLPSPFVIEANQASLPYVGLPL